MSLKYKFSILIVSIIFFMLLVVCTVLAYRNIQGLESQLKIRNQLTSEKLLPTLLGSFGDYYTYQYETYVSSVQKNMAKNPELLYFRIINLEGEMIFETSEIREGRSKGKEAKKLDDPQIQQVITTKKIYQDFISVNGQRQLRIIAPYIDNYNTFRNLVEFHFSLDQISTEIRETIFFFIVFLIIFTILGVGIGAFFVNLVTKPLVKLTKVAGQITEGNFSQQAEVLSNDEVGVLAKTFNHMVLNLRENLVAFHNEQIKLQASIKSLSVGFIMVDKDFKIISINAKARESLSSSSNSPLATIQDCNFNHIEDELKGVLDLRNLINQCFTEKRTLVAQEVQLHNRYLKIVVSPIETIGVIGSVILIDDITELKITQRSKDEFFSIASHELRTPLTAIRGNTSMIKEFYGDKIKEPELNEMIDDIHTSSVRLIEIVNDFLNTSRLEMGKMTFKKEAFDILKLAQDTIKEYTTTGSQKKLYLKIEDPVTPIPQVLADSNKVKQVLINLIGNAIKFTDTGGITIKITTDGNIVKVFVTDTGHGITPESQILLFRKFQQAEDNILTRDTTRGTGLGLYISRLMMEGMGGSIKIESSVINVGTTFSISLPIASESKPVTT